MRISDGSSDLCSSDLPARRSMHYRGVGVTGRTRLSQLAEGSDAIPVQAVEWIRGCQCGERMDLPVLIEDNELAALLGGKGCEAGRQRLDFRAVPRADRHFGGCYGRHEQR